MKAIESELTLTVQSIQNCLAPIVVETFDYAVRVNDFQVIDFLQHPKALGDRHSRLCSSQFPRLQLTLSDQVPRGS